MTVRYLIFWIVNSILHSANRGGGIASGGGMANVIRTQILNNIASEQGGGVHMGASASYILLTVTDSAINNNRSEGDGAGLYLSSGAVITNSTISGNTTNSGDGGGVFSDIELTVKQSTLVNNNAARGGGLFVVDKSSNHARIGTSIVAFNQAAQSPDLGNGIVESLGYNLIGSLSGAYIGGDQTGNLYGVDPLINPLDPGGFHSLQQGSSAIDAADPNDCSVHDQRLWARPVDGNGDGAARCDIGAFEYYP